MNTMFEEEKLMLGVAESVGTLSLHELRQTTDPEALRYWEPPPLGPREPEAPCEVQARTGPASGAPKEAG